MSFKEKNQIVLNPSTDFERIKQKYLLPLLGEQKDGWDP